MLAYPLLRVEFDILLSAGIKDQRVVLFLSELEVFGWQLEGRVICQGGLSKAFTQTY